MSGHVPRRVATGRWSADEQQQAPGDLFARHPVRVALATTPTICARASLLTHRFEGSHVVGPADELGEAAGAGQVEARAVCADALQGVPVFFIAVRRVGERLARRRTATSPAPAT